MNHTKYDNKNKKSGEHGYKNRRHTDMMANMFGGLLGKAAKAMKKQRKKMESGK